MTVIAFLEFVRAGYAIYMLVKRAIPLIG